jgi:hypothetical protein
MPIRLDAETLHHALARLEEWDHDAAADARASLSWLGWDVDAPLHLRRYDLLLHLWYELPTKVSASLERKHARAVALGRLLEMTPAAGYAPICRESQTLDQIALWETSDARARRALGRLLDASGMEPPDTPLLAWSSVMGLVEAEAREDVAYALEAGTIPLGTTDFKRRQAEVVADVLTPDRLESIHAERLEGWRDDHRSAARTAIIDRMADTLTRPPVTTDVSDAVVIARWLLDRGVDGIALTQTGALNRALVREAVELRPDWRDTALFGPPNREDEIVPLVRLHQLLRDLRLLRRSGRSIVATKRARTLLVDPAALLAECAPALLAGDTFEAAVGELAAALMLAGERIEYDSLARVIHPAVVEQGWHSAGVPPSIHAVGATIGRLLAGLEALDLVTGTRRSGLELTPAGHHALHVGLRARAIGPRGRF